jgi:hypothetical protein
MAGSTIAQPININPDIVMSNFRMAHPGVAVTACHNSARHEMGQSLRADSGWRLFRLQLSIRRDLLGSEKAPQAPSEKVRPLHGRSTEHRDSAKNGEARGGVQEGERPGALVVGHALDRPL